MGGKEGSGFSQKLTRIHLTAVSVCQVRVWHAGGAAAEPAAEGAAPVQPRPQHLLRGVLPSPRHPPPGDVRTREGGRLLHRLALPITTYGNAHVCSSVVA